jgi:hypothetical protein
MPDSEAASVPVTIARQRALLVDAVYYDDILMALPPDAAP